jgi:hypothetical protein
MKLLSLLCMAASTSRLPLEWFMVDWNWLKWGVFEDVWRCKGFRVLWLRRVLSKRLVF